MFFAGVSLFAALGFLLYGGRYINFFMFFFTSVGPLECLKPYLLSLLESHFFSLSLAFKSIPIFANEVSLLAGPGLKCMFLRNCLCKLHDESHG